MQTNADLRTVRGFGEEWSRFDQSELGEAERLQIFESYFRIFSWESLPKETVGFDIVLTIYFSLARTTYLLNQLRFNASALPLPIYKDKSFYTMRTDAPDLLRTKLEHRFSKKQIEEMLTETGLEKIKFSEEIPFWCAVGIKK